MRVTAVLFMIVLFAVPAALAQIPTVNIYYDRALQQNWQACGEYPSQIDTLYVVARDFGMMMHSIEFAIVPPTAGAVYMGDIHMPGAVATGNSTDGVTITFPAPKDASVYAVVMCYEIVWVCDDCETVMPRPAPFYPVPHPATGHLRAIEAGTGRAVDGTGMTSWVCKPPVRTDESTWGCIKALYR
jgi:hypothetical protein